MSCTNCFNGCTEITSDKCVRYTGADIPELGIQNGDTLQFVEQTLAQYIISALDGSGIKPVIDPTIICSVVSANLPTCGEFTITDLITALIKSICDLQESIEGIVADITEINAELGILNAPYSVPDCIEGTVDNESTHSVLQALLVNFCALVIGLPNTYVALNGPGGIDDIINQALEDQGLTGPVTKEYTKMVPYVAYPWFAPISVTSDNFDSNGAGLSTGPYQYVYFCNGNFPGVPDLRGRVLAGVINGMGGSTLPADVDPGVSVLNPNYTLGMRSGTNYVTLGINEMPRHTHTNSAVTSIPPHNHNYTLPATTGGGGTNALSFDGNNNSPVTLTTANANLDATTTVTIDENGFNGAHTNTQPTVGCYYIMYIPPA
jgi:microcystin-dependent protein